MARSSRSDWSWSLEIGVSAFLSGSKEVNSWLARVATLCTVQAEQAPTNKGRLGVKYGGFETHGWLLKDREKLCPDFETLNPEKKINKAYKNMRMLLN